MQNTQFHITYKRNQNSIGGLGTHLDFAVAQYQLQKVDTGKQLMNLEYNNYIPKQEHSDLTSSLCLQAMQKEMKKVIVTFDFDDESP